MEKGDKLEQNGVKGEVISKKRKEVTNEYGDKYMTSVFSVEFENGITKIYVVRDLKDSKKGAYGDRV